MVKRAFSIGIPVLLTTIAVQAAFKHPGTLHKQADQNMFKNMMLNKSYTKPGF